MTDAKQASPPAPTPARTASPVPATPGTPREFTCGGLTVHLTFATEGRTLPQALAAYLGAPGDGKKGDEA